MPPKKKRKISKQTKVKAAQPPLPEQPIPDTKVRDTETKHSSTLPKTEPGRTTPPQTTLDTAAEIGETSTPSSRSPSPCSPIGSITVTGVSNAGRVGTANTAGIQYNQVGVSGVTKADIADKVMAASVQGIGDSEDWKLYSAASSYIGDTGMKRDIKKMINEGVPTSIYHDKNLMLFEACSKGILKIVRETLVSGADINHRGSGGLTLVMVAAVRGYKQLFDLLIQQGCDLSLKLDNGNNILHLACLGRNADIVKYIVSHNIESIESKGMNEQTPVMKAASVGDKIIFDFLVSQGCDLTITDDKGSNVLHLACFSENVGIVGYTSLTTLLI